MQAECFEALLIPIADGVSLRLMDEARPARQTCTVTLPHNYTAVPSERRLDAPKPSDRPPFLYDATATENGLNALRIFELRDYSWKLEYEGNAPDVSISSSL